ncbi:MAG: hypothetical protein JWM42_38, partial [Burkholderia sp.]|nr:hypothetical protein [Burkholderia sp.]
MPKQTPEIEPRRSSPEIPANPKPEPEIQVPQQPVPEIPQLPP